MLSLFKKLHVPGVFAKLFDALFIILLLFIPIVSSIDIYWSIHNQSELINVEKNPLGRYLINADGGSIGLFMSFKALGTVLVFGILILLYKYRKKWAWAAIITIATIQFLLLIYLLFWPIFK